METEKLLAQNFSEDHPSDAALILERLLPEEAAAYLNDLLPRTAADVLQRMVAPIAAACLAQLSSQRFAAVISALPLDRAAALLRRLEPERQAPLLQQAPSDVADLLARLLRYPENSAGALMDPRALALPPDITAGEALARVRSAPRHAFYYLYVVNREQKLVGVMNLRELMLAAPRDVLHASMQRELAALNALAGRSAIIEHPGWRHVHALPVVDDHGSFLGVVRYATLRRLEKEIATPAPVTGALDAVITLGELCWVGLAGVLTDFTASIAGQASQTAAGKEPTRG